MEEDGSSLSTRPVVEVSQEVLTITGIFLTIVAIVSTLGNGSFIAVLLRSRGFRRDAHLILLMSMATCDLGISIFGYPFNIVSCFAGTWVFGDFFCQMYAFMCFTLAMISANTLVVISIFRYIIICKPQSKHRLTPRVSCICIAATVFYALIFTLSPVFGWSAYTYEPFGASCSFDWYDQSNSGLSYSISATIFCYVVHLSVMSVCYHKIYKRVSQLKLDSLTPPLSSDTENNEEEKSCLTRICFDAALNFEIDQSNINHHRNQRTYKIEIQVLKLNLLMVLTFFVIWSPYAVMSFVSIYHPDLPAFWYIFPTVFAKMSCMMNPLLYGLTNSSLRRELRHLWQDICCQGKTDAEDRHCHYRNRRYGKDGEIDRPIYDKEGVYLGKVNQGTCMCSGCVESRREVELLIRLQTQRSRDSELNATSIVETSHSGEESHLKQNPKKLNGEFTEVEG
ncbi:rhodopsin, G0-coupled-like [Daphnia pulex]|uniref:rhodopsin, G0-coupled-like n=1 Tax=Daphnia pulex TaxID=6669 RepID=UPI001EDF962D|nr:rhodopsin, G0-coupled-like [Daphnia pulex]